jgi:hypothetical protein
MPRAWQKGGRGLLRVDLSAGAVAFVDSRIFVCLKTKPRELTYISAGRRGIF